MEEAGKKRIQLLWNEVTEYGASRTEEALTLLMEALASLLDAQHAYWTGALLLSNTAEQDPMQGWRPRVVRFLNPTKERLLAEKEYFRRIDCGKIDPTITANLQKAGQFRVSTSHELAPPGWFDSEFYLCLYAPFEVIDTIYVAIPLGSDIESWLAFERIGKDKPLFGETERELLDYSMRPMKWFHHQLVLHHGVTLANEPLKPAERRVLNSLLTQKTEQEIAEEHGLTQATVHTYCTRIYRKFNVRGRAGLTALWLGKIPSS